MLHGAQVAVVVPAWNEERLLPRTLGTVPSFVDRIVVVDDGSHDATAARARSAADPRVDVVAHTRRRGVGAAITSGYRRAFALGADVAAVMAADGQMDPADLVSVVGPVARGEAAYCKGNRLAHPDAVRRMPAARLLGSLALSAATRAATGLLIHDSQCGYTALARRAAEALPLEALWPGYGYPNDLLGYLAELGEPVQETTVRPVYGDEDSGLRLYHGLVVVPFVIARSYLRRQRRRPSPGPAAPGDAPLPCASES